MTRTIEGEVVQVISPEDRRPDSDSLFQRLLGTHTVIPDDFEAYAGESDIAVVRTGDPPSGVIPSLKRWFGHGDYSEWAPTVVLREGSSLAEGVTVEFEARPAPLTSGTVFVPV